MNSEQIANMSDEEILNMDWSFDAEDSDTSSDITEDTGSDEPVVDLSEEDTLDEPEQEIEQDEEVEESEEVEEQDTPEEVEDSVEPSELDKLVGVPIEHQGKTITLNSVDEVLAMVKQSMALSSQVTSMEVHEPLIAMLEENQLLDSSKLSMAIDLLNGNPDAIRKLIADKQISMDDIDSETENKYQPSDKSLSQEKIKLSNTLKKLQESSEGVQVINTIANWDEQSKNLLSKHPENLNHLEAHVRDGTFTKVVGEIERQKMLGQLPQSTPMAQAYQHVLGLMMQQQQQSQPEEKVVPDTPTKPKKSKARAQSVSNATTAGSKPNYTPEDVANMTDEQVLKLFN
ncbi:hypothetical protein VOWphi5012_012 [Vibrio phage phi50-12]|uniref:Uncharacterized protein n=1 Tax=Vibrio phage phi50-12 TaxID=2654972 RepID=A0A5P8PRA6_9CAUD|nr:tail length tape measure protein [Vibrio phage phi50-12]QFR59796.1 hypothetical protein VOWphi5012_012 [Vibrio phage phi50-12]